MFEVTVEAGFSSGHYLRNYHGKCVGVHAMCPKNIFSGNLAK
jgi:hypothetical protein